MFILRKITGSGLEMNFYLGENYTLILKNKNPKDFEEWQEIEPHYKDDCFYGIINYEKGSMGLSVHQKAFIMVNGKTVDHISANPYALKKCGCSVEKETCSNCNQ